MKKYVASRHYDIGDGEIGRTIRFALLDKFVPLGYFAGAASLKILFILFFLHRFSRPVFRLIMSQEEKLTKVYLKLRKPVTEKENGHEQV